MMMRRLLWASLLLAGALDRARAAPVPAEPAAVEESGPRETVETAVVTLDGKPLFQVRGMAGYGAKARAEAIARRIEAVAADPRVSTETIALNHLADRSNLMAGDTLLAVLLDADGAAEGIPRLIMAEGARRNTILAIVDFRHDRSAAILVRRTALAMAATFLMALFVFGLGRGFHWLREAAERHVKTRMEALETRSSKVIEMGPLWKAFVGFLSAVRVLLVIVAAYLWLHFVLGLYPWTNPWATRLLSIFVEPLKVFGAAFVKALPNLAFLAVLAFIVRYVLKITSLFFAAIGKGTLRFNDFDQDWAWPTYRIVRVLILCFAAVVAYPYIPGSSSDAFKGVSLFVGVLFSLGSSSFVANIIAGTTMTYRRAFKIGDVVRMNDIKGVVTEMRLQGTHMRTVKNEEVVIPNSLVLNSHVVNYSTLARQQGLILHTTVGIGYETPWRQVDAMLKKAASRTQGLLTEPSPFVLKKALKDFCVEYELNVYCKTPLLMTRLYSDLHKNILDVFNEYEVQIMTPAYEGDPETPKIVSKDRWHAAPADSNSDNTATAESTTGKAETST